MNAPAPAAYREERQLVTAATLLLRHRRWFFATALTVGTVIIVVGFPRYRTYTSVASFITEQQRAASGVAGLASQFGVTVSGSSGSVTSPLFYPELLKSGQFMQSVVEAKFPASRPNDSNVRSLVQLYNAETADPRLSKEYAQRILNESMSVTAAPQTGIVKISITAEQPHLAQAIADTILAKVQEFNIRARQGRASAERRFVERRLDEIRTDLRNAEDRLQAFLLQNRDLSKSPALQFAHSRMQQDVTMLRQLYLNISQSFEQAKIDEVRDTPVITTLSKPELPVIPNPRGLVRLLAIALFASLGLGTLAVFIADQFKGRPVESDNELHTLARQFRGDLRRGRLIRALFGSTGTGPTSTHFEQVRS